MRNIVFLLSLALIGMFFPTPVAARSTGPPDATVMADNTVINKVASGVEPMLMIVRATEAGRIVNEDTGVVGTAWLMTMNKGDELADTHTIVNCQQNGNPEPQEVSYSGV